MAGQVSELHDMTAQATAAAFGDSGECNVHNPKHYNNGGDILHCFCTALHFARWGLGWTDGLSLDKYDDNDVH